MPEEGVRVTDTGIRGGGNCCNLLATEKAMSSNEEIPEEAVSDSKVRKFVVVVEAHALGLDSMRQSVVEQEGQTVVHCTMMASSPWKSLASKLFARP